LLFFDLYDRHWDIVVFRLMGSTAPDGPAIGQAFVYDGFGALAMYQLTARIIGGLLIACGLTLGAIGIGAFLSDANGALLGGLSFLVFGSVFGFAGYRFLRTPPDEDESENEVHTEPTRERGTRIKIAQPLIVKLRLVLGPLSAVAYLTCWASLPTGIIGPIATGLFWLSFVIWFFSRTTRGAPRWNRLGRIALAVTWCLHVVAWHFVQEVPRVDRFALPLYAVTTVGPDVYSRMRFASYSLTAFIALLGPWQRRPKTG
jgi:hypothetical protein